MFKGQKLRAAAVYFLTAASALSFAVAGPQSDSSVIQSSGVRGGDLFYGRVELKGRLSTHLTVLPTDVVRCSNCHAVGNGAAVPRSTAPRLTREWLTVQQHRRGGPRARYDRDAFCYLLRKGIDPVYVVINEEMPRYAMDDADCTALWQFITEDSHEQ